MNTILMNDFIKRLLLVVGLVGIIFFVWHAKIGDYITLEHLKTNRVYLKTYVDNHYIAAIISYIFIYIIFTACAFPAAALLTVTGGFLFGTCEATIYTVIGATIGACSAFCTYRYVIGNQIHNRYIQHQRYLNQMMHEYGSSFLLFVRLFPLIPFFLINIIASFLPITFFTFAWTTAVGIIPATLIFSFAGQQLNSITAARDILSYKVLGILGGLAILSLLPVIIKSINTRRMMK